MIDLVASLVGSVLGTAIDPFKLGWGIYLIFRPKKWPLAIAVAITLGFALAGFYTMSGPDPQFLPRSLTAHLLSSIILAVIGNWIGRSRAMRRGRREMHDG